MKQTLRELLCPQPKSKIKAGDGQLEGTYNFYTSSQTQSKFYHSAAYTQPALIFGTGGMASVHYCNKPFSTSTDCLVMYGNQGVSLELIYYYLRTNIHILQDGFKGAGLQHISKDYILNIEIDMPELSVQEKITHQMRLIDALINRKKQQIEFFAEAVKSRFVELFGGIYTNTHGFPIYQLSDYILFLTSGSRGWAKYCVDDGSEWFITIKNVKDCKISTDNIQPVKAPDNMEAKRTKVKEDDLLISITADLGRTGVVTKEIAEHGAYINQHLTCIRLNKSELIPLYVAYFMESNSGRPQFEAKNQTGVKAGLNFDSIKSLKVLIPPLELQKQFAAFVKQTDKSKYYILATLMLLEFTRKTINRRFEYDQL